MNNLKNNKFQRRAKRLYALCVCLALVMAVAVTPTFAAATGAATGSTASSQPLTVINNLNTFIFSLIRAVGMILLGYGILQVGLSFQSHDPSQRSNGMLTIAGGVVITFTKEILTLIVGSAA